MLEQQMRIIESLKNELKEKERDSNSKELKENYEK